MSVARRSPTTRTRSAGSPSRSSAAAAMCRDGLPTMALALHPGTGLDRGQHGRAVRQSAVGSRTEPVGVGGNDPGPGVHRPVGGVKLRVVEGSIEGHHHDLGRLRFRVRDDLEPRFSEDLDHQRFGDTQDLERRDALSQVQDQSVKRRHDLVVSGWDFQPTEQPGIERSTAPTACWSRKTWGVLTLPHCGECRRRPGQQHIVEVDGAVQIEHETRKAVDEPHTPPPSLCGAVEGVVHHRPEVAPGEHHQIENGEPTPQADGRWPRPIVAVSRSTGGSSSEKRVGAPAAARTAAISAGAPQPHGAPLRPARPGPPDPGGAARQSAGFTRYSDQHSSMVSESSRSRATARDLRHDGVVGNVGGSFEIEPVEGDLPKAGRHHRRHSDLSAMQTMMPSQPPYRGGD